MPRLVRRGVETPGPELPDAPLTELLTQLAEAVAEGQAKLDLSSAEVVKELAETRVSVVPSIRQIIQADGSVTYEQAQPIELSLLELGLQPTFFAFSEAVVEVAMDLKVVEETQSTSTAKKRRLFAGTQSLRTERKLNRNLQVSSKITAKLVPVPAPPLLVPSREVIDNREGGGT